MPQLSEETARELLRLQAEELKTRQGEIVLRQQELKEYSGFAKESLQTQERDRKDERVHQNKQSKLYLGAAIAIVVIVTVFAGYAIYHDKDAIVMDMTKMILSFGAGAFGGFFYGKNRRPTDTESPDSDE